MRQALQLASAAKGQTRTNPCVGCVIVKDNQILGLGSHLKQGHHHAEIHALHMAGEEAEGSTVYVTLEPCSHYGKTPPCAKALIDAKVRKVIVACEDPNPQVAGSGVSLLQEHGIEVKVGLLKQEAQRLNEVFFTYITKRRPFVTLKTASTLDGKIASADGDSKWITNKASREFVHTLRHQHQGIMVGVNTLLQDDPQLTTRLEDTGKHPVRIIIDSTLRTPLHAKVVTDKLAPTWIVTSEMSSKEKAEQLEQAGIRIFYSGSRSRVDLPEAMKQLAEAGISSILLEGGGKLNGAMLESSLIDKMILFYAPKIIGGIDAPSNFNFDGFSHMQDALQLDELQIERFGDDVCFIGYPNYKEE